MTEPAVTPLEPVTGDRQRALAVSHPEDPEFGGARWTGRGEQVGQG
ncbi:hypothetical protein [Micromonospora sp. NPDC005367]